MSFEEEPLLPSYLPWFPRRYARYTNRYLQAAVTISPDPLISTYSSEDSLQRTLSLMLPDASCLSEARLLHRDCSGAAQVAQLR